MTNAAASTGVLNKTETDAVYHDVWRHVSSFFPNAFGQDTTKSWLSPLKFKDFLSGRFIISAPTRFMRDWVATNCSETILKLLQETNPTIFALDIIVEESPKVEAAPLSNDAEEFSIDIEDQPVNDEQILGSRLDPKYTFENFVIGKPNELAHAAARRIAEADKVTFNPLFLHGGVGLGKTHLMHAIAWHIKKCHPHRKVVYLSAEKFMYLFIRALRFKDTVAFKEQFRRVDVLMIDDFQFIAGKDSTQEEFFHTFNALVDQNHQVIISADKSPSELVGLEERMRSRLGWGLVADIHPTTYELRLGILQSKVEQLNLNFPPKILEFLAHKISSNVRELEGALNRLVAHSMLVGREINIETAQEVLGDLIRANDRRVTIDEIQKKVAEHFNIRLSDIHSPRRLRAVARPRQIAMFLAKTMTPLSLPEIGRKFGGRDHTTVIHAVKKVEELRLNDQSVAEDIELLKKMLQS
ncbi:MAG: chromosomal replication initiator protein DnaA [Candidatus Nucleicultricaceae bacterium]